MKNMINKAEVLSKVKKGSIITLAILGASSLILTAYRIWTSHTHRYSVQMEDGDHTPVNE